MNKVYTRRTFIGVSAATCASMAIHLRAASITNPPEKSRVEVPSKLVDVNVTLGQWPTRRLPFDETELLVSKLRRQGVVQAWASTFDGLLHKDVAAANDRLARQCREQGRGLLLPFGALNPLLPNWESDLRSCEEKHGMKGIRLFPAYHGYKLDEPVFEQLLEAANKRRMIVQIAVAMEDERMQHPLLRVRQVEITPLQEVLKKHPRSQLVLINWNRNVKPQTAATLAKDFNVYFDIACLEGVSGLGTLLKNVPPKRVVFGSHAPFYYFEAALLKLRESVVRDQDLASVCTKNAMALLGENLKIGN